MEKMNVILEYKDKLITISFTLVPNVEDPIKRFFNKICDIFDQNMLNNVPIKDDYGDDLAYIYSVNYRSSLYNNKQENDYKI